MSEPNLRLDVGNLRDVERLRRHILGPLATAHPILDFQDALRQFAMVDLLASHLPTCGAPCGHDDCGRDLAERLLGDFHITPRGDL